MKKRLFLLLLLCLALSFSAAAAGEAQPFLAGDSNWLVTETPGGDTQILADRYVLSYHYDPQEDTVYYVALEEGQAVFYAVKAQEGSGSDRSIPIFQEEGRELVLLSAPSKSTEKMVDAAMTIIYRNEGSYGSVNKDDNGALSIGKVQWHANRALNLLKTIVEANPENALTILGEALCEEIVTADSWGSRTVNEEEALAISDLLTTEEGKAAQDALAATDITSYVNHAVNLGLCSSTAIVYFADLENQWGYSGAKKQAVKAMEAAGSYEAVTLDILHQACLDYTTKYHTRRNNVYDYCLSLGWDEFAIDAPRNLSVSSQGGRVTLSWDGVEHADSYVCYVVLPQSGFPEACEPVETTETSCTVLLEEGKSYCAYVVAKAKHSTSESSLWKLLDTAKLEATVKKTGTVHTVEVMLKNIPQSCTLLAAGYRAGQMVALQTAADSSTLTLEGELEEIRVMAVDSLTTLQPLCSARVIPGSAFEMEENGIEAGA